jgi:hypothetical protein
MNHWSLPDLCFLWIHFYFMNYKKIYDQICERAKIESDIRIQNRKLWKSSKGSNGIYYESHHIIPLCLGGDGKAFQWKHSNIVLLTAREHFICHWLLHRLNPDSISLLYAFDKMCVFSPTQSNNRYIPSSRVISEIMESRRILGRGDQFKKLMSKKFKGKKRSKLQCPYCYKIGGDGNMQRWHFNNCIKKPGNENIIRTIKINKKPEKVKCPHCQVAGASNLMNFWHFDNCPKKLLNESVRKEVECPHCSVKGGERIMKRWHFDNCKSLKI